MSRFTNPTSTGNTERAWRGDINRRWSEFTRRTTSQLRTANGLVTNADEIFQMSAGQIRTFMAFLNLQIDELLLGSDQAPNWQSTYQAQAYERGLKDSRRALISQGAKLTPTAAEFSEAQGLELSQFTAISSLGTISSTAPIHQDALEFLFTRSYESLNKWTDAMATEARQILMEGVEQGQGIDEVVRNFTKRIDVSKSRARVIAQTETIQAYQRATTNEAIRAAEEIGESVMLRWMTVRDNKVRHLHREWHGTLATPRDNFKRINTQPFNCRCAQSPVIPEADTAKKKEKFAKERRMLLRLPQKK